MAEWDSSCALSSLQEMHTVSSIETSSDSLTSPFLTDRRRKSLRHSHKKNSKLKQFSGREEYLPNQSGLEDNILNSANPSSPLQHSEDLGGITGTSIREHMSSVGGEMVSENISADNPVSPWTRRSFQSCHYPEHWKSLVSTGNQSGTTRKVKRQSMAHYESSTRKRQVNVLTNHHPDSPQRSGLFTTDHHIPVDPSAEQQLSKSSTANPTGFDPSEVSEDYDPGQEIRDVNMLSRSLRQSFKSSRKVLDLEYSGLKNGSGHSPLTMYAEEETSQHEPRGLEFGKLESPMKSSDPLDDSIRELLLQLEEEVFDMESQLYLDEEDGEDYHHDKETMRTCDTHDLSSIAREPLAELYTTDEIINSDAALKQGIVAKTEYFQANPKRCSTRSLNETCHEEEIFWDGTQFDEQILPSKPAVKEGSRRSMMTSQSVVPPEPHLEPQNEGRKNIMVGISDHPHPRTYIYYSDDAAATQLTGKYLEDSSPIHEPPLSSRNTADSRRGLHLSQRACTLNASTSYQPDLYYRSSANGNPGINSGSNVLTSVSPVPRWVNGTYEDGHLTSTKRMSTFPHSEIGGEHLTKPKVNFVDSLLLNRHISSHAENHKSKNGEDADHGMSVLRQANEEGSVDSLLLGTWADSEDSSLPSSNDRLDFSTSAGTALADLYSGAQKPLSCNSNLSSIYARMSSPMKMQDKESGDLTMQNQYAAFHPEPVEGITRAPESDGDLSRQVGYAGLVDDFGEEVGGKQNDLNREHVSGNLEQTRIPGLRASILHEMDKYPIEKSSNPCAPAFLKEVHQGKEVQNYSDESIDVTFIQSMHLSELEEIDNSNNSCANKDHLQAPKTLDPSGPPNRRSQEFGYGTNGNDQDKCAIMEGGHFQDFDMGKADDLRPEPIHHLLDCYGVKGHALSLPVLPDRGVVDTSLKPGVGRKLVQMPEHSNSEREQPNIQLHKRNKGMSSTMPILQFTPQRSVLQDVSLLSGLGWTIQVRNVLRRTPKKDWSDLVAKAYWMKRLRIGTRVQKMLKQEEAGQMQSAILFHEVSLLHKYLLAWEASTLLSRQEAEAVSKRDLLAGAFRALKAAVELREEQTRRLQERLERGQLRSLFNKWHQRSLLNHERGVAAVTFYHQRCLTAAFSKWKQAPDTARKMRVATLHYKLWLLSSCLLRWKVFVSDQKVKHEQGRLATVFNQERILKASWDTMKVALKKRTRATQRDRKQTMTRVIRAWRHATQLSRLEALQLNQWAQQFRQSHLLRAHLDAWSEGITVVKAQRRVDLVKVRFAFNLWRLKLERKRLVARIVASKMRRVTKLRIFTAWKQETHRSRERRAEAVKLLQLSVRRRFFEAWVCLCADRAEDQKRVDICQRQSAVGLTRDCFATWLSALHTRHRVREEESERRERLCRRCVIIWKQTVKTKWQEKQVHLIQERMETGCMKAAFNMWKEAYEGSRWDQDRASEVQSILTATTMGNIFRSWRLAAKERALLRPMWERQRERIINRSFSSLRFMVQRKKMAANMAEQRHKKLVTLAYIKWRQQYLASVQLRLARETLSQNQAKRVFAAWLLVTRQKSLGKRLAEEKSMCSLRWCFLGWRKRWQDGEMERDRLRGQQARAVVLQKAVIRRWHLGISHLIEEVSSQCTHVSEVMQRNLLIGALHRWKKAYQDEIMARDHYRSLFRRRFSVILSRWLHHAHSSLKHSTQIFNQSLSASTQPWTNHLVLEDSTADDPFRGGSEYSGTQRLSGIDSGYHGNLVSSVIATDRSTFQSIIDLTSVRGLSDSELMTSRSVAVHSEETESSCSYPLENSTVHYSETSSYSGSSENGTVLSSIPYRAGLTSPGSRGSYGDSNENLPHDRMDHSQLEVPPNDDDCQEIGDTSSAYPRLNENNSSNHLSNKQSEPKAVARAEMGKTENQKYVRALFRESSPKDDISPPVSRLADDESLSSDPYQPLGTTPLKLSHRGLADVAGNFLGSTSSEAGSSIRVWDASNAGGCLSSSYVLSTVTAMPEKSNVLRDVWLGEVSRGVGERPAQSGFLGGASISPGVIWGGGMQQNEKDILSSGEYSGGIHRDGKENIVYMIRFWQLWPASAVFLQWLAYSKHRNILQQLQHDFITSSETRKRLLCFQRWKHHHKILQLALAHQRMALTRRCFDALSGYTQRKMRYREDQSMAERWQSQRTLLVAYQQWKSQLLQQHTSHSKTSWETFRDKHRQLLSHARVVKRRRQERNVEECFMFWKLRMWQLEQVRVRYQQMLMQRTFEAWLEWVEGRRCRASQMKLFQQRRQKQKVIIKWRRALHVHLRIQGMRSRVNRDHLRDILHAWHHYAQVSKAEQEKMVNFGQRVTLRTLRQSLGQWQEELGKKQKAQGHYDKIISRKCLQSLHSYRHCQISQRTASITVRGLQTRRLLREALATWRREITTRRRVSMMRQKQHDSLLRAVLGAWRDFVLTERERHRHIQGKVISHWLALCDHHKKTTMLVRNAFQKWRNFVAEMRHLTMLESSYREDKNRQVIQRSWQKWGEESHKVEAATEYHQASLLKRCLHAWCQHSKIGQEQQKMLNDFQVTHDQRLTERCFSHWRAEICKMKQLKSLMEEYEQIKSQRLLFAYLRLWQRASLEKKADTHHRRTVHRKVWSKWSKALKNTAVIHQFRGELNRRKMRAAFKALYSWRNSSQGQRQKLTDIQEKCGVHLVKLTFTSWRKQTSHRRTADQCYHGNLLNMHFRAWREVASNKKRLKQLSSEAAGMFASRQIIQLVPTPTTAMTDETEDISTIPRNSHPSPLAVCFRHWQLRMRERSLAKLRALSLTRKAANRWRCRVELQQGVRKREHRLVKQAASHYQHNLLRIVLSAWSQESQHQIYLRTRGEWLSMKYGSIWLTRTSNNIMATQLNHYRVMQTIWSQWRRHFIQSAVSKRFLEEEQRLLCAKVFDAWKEYRDSAPSKGNHHC